MILGVRIDRHISVGHIITTVGAIVAGVSAYYSMESRVRIVEISLPRLDKQVDDAKREHAQALDKIYYKLEKIEEKLDRKADKL